MIRARVEVLETNGSRTGCVSGGLHHQRGEDVLTGKRSSCRRARRPYEKPAEPREPSPCGRSPVDLGAQATAMWMTLGLSVLTGTAADRT